jgi:arylsulfatase A-like enzyme
MIGDRNQPFAMLYHFKAPHRFWMPDIPYLDFLEDHVFDFPENFFDDYEGRGAAAREQEMEIVNHMFWGADMKLEKDPRTGEYITTMPVPLGRKTDEQLEAWREVYDPLNDAFLKGIHEDNYESIFLPNPRNINLDFLQNTPEGLHLAKFMYHRYLRDYLKTVKSVDDGIGKVLEYLEENDLLDNTVVIYTSDQGFYLGEHGWYDKRFMYEESLSTPLLVRYPKEITPGTVVNNMVLNLDLAPSILDYADIDIPDDMQGMSWREVVAGKEIPWRDAIYYHYYAYPDWHMVKRHYGIRTDRYKLIHFYSDIDEWEMYDLENDPMEMRSAYGDPSYSEIQKMLHGKLNEIRVKYGDSDELTQEFLKDDLSDGY